MSAPAAFPEGACTSVFAMLVGQFVGLISEDGEGYAGGQLACVNRLDMNVYLAGLGLWGTLTGIVTSLQVQDVNAGEYLERIVPRASSIESTVRSLLSECTTT